MVHGRNGAVKLLMVIIITFLSSEQCVNKVYECRLFVQACHHQGATVLPRDHWSNWRQGTNHEDSSQLRVYITPGGALED